MHDSNYYECDAFAVHTVRMGELLHKVFFDAGK